MLSDARPTSPEAAATRSGADVPFAADVPDPVKPQDLRLRKRRILAGMGIGVAGNAALIALWWAVLETLGRYRDTVDEGSVILGQIGATAVLNVAAIVLLALRRRREWAIGIAVVDALFVASVVGLFVWISSHGGWC